MAQASAGSAGSGDGKPAEQRREQLLRAALDVIVARGYADTRIADVAEHAGTSPALVIYYFKTRDQLLTEALRYSEDSWYAAGTQRLAAIPTAAGRLTELVAMTCLPDTDPGTKAGSRPSGCSGSTCGRSPRAIPGWPRCGTSSTSGGGRRSRPRC
jgi:AcrR family transcriptional regulator